VRVLFLGGTSFTGPHAVRELVEDGHEVTVFHRGETEAELPAEVRHVHGDVSRFGEHVAGLRELRPEVVVDLLAFLPHEGARVRAFAGVARRGVLVSSADVYRAYGRLRRTEPGPPEPTPLAEDAPLREVVVDETYDKVGVEREARADPAFPVTVLRYPAVHGPGDAQHRLAAYVRRMDDGRPAILLQEGHDAWRWARGYCEDVGHALALAVRSEEAAGRTYNVAGPRALDGRTWLQAVADAAGWSGEIAVVPGALMPDSLRLDADFAQHYDLDTTRIRAELGYAEVVDERTALERTVAWERAHPPAGEDPDYALEDEVLAALGSAC
jgi:nucleoside-diphosphate-sugar epimerase